MSGPASTSAQLPRPGDIVGGKYVIESLIGQGGMGAVFKGKHRVTGGVRAIKVMLAEANNAEARQRFMNEARAAAEIQNEHVVRVDDVDEELGYAFMVLELLDGEDLSQILDREKRPLPPHVAVSYVLQALRGVAQAHALGIVHRDLKPSNLFLSNRSDGSKTVKVLDFGISKASSANALAQSPNALTSTKAMLGSPLYMSPEQLRSSKSVDQRADIWAIGVILFELMTLTLPFMGDNLGELFAAILENDPPSLSTRVQGVPAGLDAVVLRCLRRRPEERFQTAKELAEALAPFAQASSTHGSTAFLGQSPMYQPSPATPTGPGLPQAFAQTPNRPMPPPQGAITGSGSAPRAIPNQPQGTVAMGTTPAGGAVPPNQFGGTNSAWNAEQPVGIPTNKTNPGIIAGVVGAFLVMAGIGVVFFLKSRDPKIDPTTANPPPSASIAAPVPTPSTAPTETTATPTPTASSSAAVAATTTTTATATPPVQPVVHTNPNSNPKPFVKVDPPKPVDPPKTAEKPTVPPTPTPKPTSQSSSGGPIQNTR